MSGNRKRTGSGGILDQLDPRPARTRAATGFSIGIEPRWLWAGGGAIVLLVAVLASIAWSTTTTAQAMPAAGEFAHAPVLDHKPEFEAGPAKVERVSLQAHKGAAVLLAKVEPPPMPPPMPLVVLPKQPSSRAAAKVVRQPSRPKQDAAASGRARSAAKPPVQRQAARKTVPKPQRAKPEPVPEAAQDADPDVALIRAIRKATQTPSQ